MLKFRAIDLCSSAIDLCSSWRAGVVRGDGRPGNDAARSRGKAHNESPRGKSYNESPALTMNRSHRARRILASSLATSPRSPTSRHHPRHQPSTPSPDPMPRAPSLSYRDIGPRSRHHSCIPIAAAFSSLPRGRCILRLSGIMPTTSTLPVKPTSTLPVKPTSTLSGIPTSIKYTFFEHSTENSIHSACILRE